MLRYFESNSNDPQSKGAFTLIDPHNFARYNGVVIGTGNVPATAFADFWTRLANLFKSNDKVIFGIMNEPNDMSTELWLADANAAIKAIRDAGATNLLFVPGNGFTGAHSWFLNFYGTPNAQVMLGVVDPLNNFVIEVHQYLDVDSSGTNIDCVSATIGSERMQQFTQWLRDNNRKGFLGEIGGGRDSVCVSAIDDILSFVGKNSDLYVGWTYWAGGPK
jgi:endoglucanase